MARGSTRGSTPPSRVGGVRTYQLSTTYGRSRAQGASRFSRPSAKLLRAGRAVGHPRPDGKPEPSDK